MVFGSPVSPVSSVSSVSEQPPKKILRRLRLSLSQIGPATDQSSSNSPIASPIASPISSPIVNGYSAPVKRPADSFTPISDGNVKRVRQSRKFFDDIKENLLSRLADIKSEVLKKGCWNLHDIDELSSYENLIGLNITNREAASLFENSPLLLHRFCLLKIDELLHSLTVKESKKPITETRFHILEHPEPGSYKTRITLVRLHFKSAVLHSVEALRPTEFFSNTLFALKDSEYLCDDSRCSVVRFSDKDLGDMLPIKVYSENIPSYGPSMQLKFNKPKSGSSFWDTLVSEERDVTIDFSEIERVRSDIDASIRRAESQVELHPLIKRIADRSESDRSDQSPHIKKAIVNQHLGLASLLYLPTGSGKTYIAALTMAQHYRNNVSGLQKSYLVLVPKDNVQSAWQDNLSDIAGLENEKGTLFDDERGLEYKTVGSVSEIDTIISELQQDIKDKKPPRQHLTIIMKEKLTAYIQNCLNPHESTKRTSQQDKYRQILKVAGILIINEGKNSKKKRSKKENSGLIIGSNTNDWKKKIQNVLDRSQINLSNIYGNVEKSVPAHRFAWPNKRNFIDDFVSYDNFKQMFSKSDVRLLASIEKICGITNSDKAFDERIIDLYQCLKDIWRCQGLLSDSRRAEDQVELADKVFNYACELAKKQRDGILKLYAFLDTFGGIVCDETHRIYSETTANTISSKNCMRYIMSYYQQRSVEGAVSNPLCLLASATPWPNNFAQLGYHLDCLASKYMKENTRLNKHLFELWNNLELKTRDYFNCVDDEEVQDTLLQIKLNYEKVSTNLHQWIRLFYDNLVIDNNTGEQQRLHASNSLEKRLVFKPWTGSDIALLKTLKDKIEQDGKSKDLSASKSTDPAVRNFSLFYNSLLSEKLLGPITKGSGGAWDKKRISREENRFADWIDQHMEVDRRTKRKVFNLDALSPVFRGIVDIILREPDSPVGIYVSDKLPALYLRKVIRQILIDTGRNDEILFFYAKQFVSTAGENNFDNKRNLNLFNNIFNFTDFVENEMSIFEIVETATRGKRKDVRESDKREYLHEGLKYGLSLLYALVRQSMGKEFSSKLIRAKVVLPSTEEGEAYNFIFQAAYRALGMKQVGAEVLNKFTIGLTVDTDTKKELVELFRLFILAARFEDESSQRIIYLEKGEFLDEFEAYLPPDIKKLDISTVEKFKEYYKKIEDKRYWESLIGSYASMAKYVLIRYVAKMSRSLIFIFGEAGISGMRIDASHSFKLTGFWAEGEEDQTDGRFGRDKKGVSQSGIVKSDSIKGRPCIVNNFITPTLFSFFMLHYFIKKSLYQRFIDSKHPLSQDELIDPLFIAYRLFQFIRSNQDFVVDGLADKIQALIKEPTSEQDYLNNPALYKALQLLPQHLTDDLEAFRTRINTTRTTSGSIIATSPNTPGIKPVVADLIKASIFEAVLWERDFIQNLAKFLMVQQQKCVSHLYYNYPVIGLIENSLGQKIITIRVTASDIDEDGLLAIKPSTIPEDMDSSYFYVRILYDHPLTQSAVKKIAIEPVHIKDRRYDVMAILDEVKTSDEQIKNHSRGLKSGYYALAACILQLEESLKNQILVKIGFSDPTISLHYFISEQQVALGEAIFAYVDKYSAKIFSTEIQQTFNAKLQELLKHRSLLVPTRVDREINEDEINDIIDKLQQESFETTILHDRLSFIAAHFGLNLAINKKIVGRNEFGERIDILNDDGYQYEAYYPKMDSVVTRKSENGVYICSKNDINHKIYADLTVSNNTVLLKYVEMANQLACVELEPKKFVEASFLPFQMVDSEAVRRLIMNSAAVSHSVPALKPLPSVRSVLPVIHEMPESKWLESEFEMINANFNLKKHTAVLMVPSRGVAPDLSLELFIQYLHEAMQELKNEDHQKDVQVILLFGVNGQESRSVQEIYDNIKDSAEFNEYGTIFTKLLPFTWENNDETNKDKPPIGQMRNFCLTRVKELYDRLFRDKFTKHTLLSMDGDTRITRKSLDRSLYLKSPGPLIATAGYDIFWTNAENIKMSLCRLKYKGEILDTKMPKLEDTDETWSSWWTAVSSRTSMVVNSSLTFENNGNLWYYAYPPEPLMSLNNKALALLMLAFKGYDQLETVSDAPFGFWDNEGRHLIKFLQSVASEQQAPELKILSTQGPDLESHFAWPELLNIDAFGLKSPFAFVPKQLLELGNLQCAISVMSQQRFSSLSSKITGSNVAASFQISPLTGSRFASCFNLGNMLTLLNLGPDRSHSLLEMYYKLATTRPIDNSEEIQKRFGHSQDELEKYYNEKFTPNLLIDGSVHLEMVKIFIKWGLAICREIKSLFGPYYDGEFKAGNYLPMTLVDDYPHKAYIRDSENQKDVGGEVEADLSSEPATEIETFLMNEKQYAEQLNQYLGSLKGPAMYFSNNSPSLLESLNVHSLGIISNKSSFIFLAAQFVTESNKNQLELLNFENFLREKKSNAVLIQASESEHTIHFTLLEWSSFTNQITFNLVDIVPEGVNPELILQQDKLKKALFGTELLKSIEKMPVSCTTEGDGNCAFHAVFGECISGEYISFDAGSKRRELARHIRTATPGSELERLCKEGIKDLVMRGSTIRGLESLKHAYQEDILSPENTTVQWGIFEKTLRNYDDIVNYITMQSEPEIPNVTLRQQFEAINANETELRALILSIPELDEAWERFNQNTTREFNWETAISQNHVNAYAVYIARSGQWLLPFELQMIAEAFDIRLNFYNTNAAGQLIGPEIYNAEGHHEVSVSFNGRNHYERVELR